MSANGHAEANGHASVIDLGDRKPPQNIDAEMGVLGGILRDNDKLTEVIALGLVPGHFYRDAHQVLYQAILDLYEIGRAVDAVTLADILLQCGRFEDIGGDRLLTELTEAVPSAANTVCHAEIVIEHANRRLAIEMATEVLRDGYSPRFTASQLLDKASDLIARVSFVTGEDELDMSSRPWPAAPDPAALYGVAGQIIRLIEPHSEADPAAILVQFLTAFGNLMGRNPFWISEATFHRGNTFTCIVGNSSQARKGTSWDHVRSILAQVDPEWKSRCLHKNMSTGEGVVMKVRDAMSQPGKNGEVKYDPGAEDKRALWIETEFGTTLSVMGREGNNLEGVLRQAWDGEELGNGNKNSPLKATEAHVSVITHITMEDLARRLSDNSAANGFANRFQWVCARRSKSLPHGGQIQKVHFDPIVERLKEAVGFAKFKDEKTGGLFYIRDDEANRIWEPAYDELTTPVPGLFGAIIQRGAPIVMRLAMVYAVLDLSGNVKACHLRAALAVWKYCRDSAAYIFGDRLGDPLAERILLYLKAEGQLRNFAQIRRKMGSNRVSAQAVQRSLLTLERCGSVSKSSVTKAGRSCTFWTAV